MQSHKVLMLQLLLFHIYTFHWFCIHLGDILESGGRHIRPQSAPRKTPDMGLVQYGEDME